MPLWSVPRGFTGRGPLLDVEVVYALPERQMVKSLSVDPGATVRQAIFASKICEEFPEIDLSQNPVGIYSKKVPLDHVLKNGDRVEIYRPLKVSPKEARRLRAENARSAKNAQRDKKA